MWTFVVVIYLISNGEMLHTITWQSPSKALCEMALAEAKPDGLEIQDVTAVEISKQCHFRKTT